MSTPGSLASGVTVGSILNVSAQTVDIPAFQLVGDHVGGDTDFWMGPGRPTYVQALATLNSDGSSLWIEAHFWAKEINSNWTEAAKHYGPYKVFSAPPGKTIASFSPSGTNGRTLWDRNIEGPITNQVIQFPNGEILSQLAITVPAVIGPTRPTAAFTINQITVYLR